MPHIQVDKGDFKMSPCLHREILHAIEDCLYDDDDFVIIICGEEGAGKSLLARQIGAFVGEKTGNGFGIDNIHFDADAYKEASEKSKKKAEVNILDETRSSLLRSSSTTKKNKLFTNWFSENRNKNQIHVLLLPAYHDLDKYMAIWRVKLVIKVIKSRIADKDRESGKKIQRGHYALYSPDELREYYFRQSTFGYYRYPAPTVKGAFPAFEPLEDISGYERKKEEFRQKKAEALDENKKEEKQLPKPEVSINKNVLELKSVIRKYTSITMEEIKKQGKILGVSEEEIESLVAKMKEKYELVSLNSKEYFIV